MTTTTTKAGTSFSTSASTPPALAGPNPFLYFQLKIRCGVVRIVGGYSEGIAQRRQQTNAERTTDCPGQKQLHFRQRGPPDPVEQQDYLRSSNISVLVTQSQKCHVHVRDTSQSSCLQMLSFYLSFMRSRSMEVLTCFHSYHNKPETPHLASRKQHRWQMRPQGSFPGAERLARHCISKGHIILSCQD